eukprot:TRINITY_DN5608_c0_g1_i1.p1 TRINITY_DN5608_c0_g1~~TRINITY_DN5608_c0_g1_i1.p1  ORF type:complete len:531 (-),score=78.18 TRINITY_DN5608_c0_g1_i1:49-1641(-)
MAAAHSLVQLSLLILASLILCAFIGGSSRHLGGVDAVFPSGYGRCPRAAHYTTPPAIHPLLQDHLDAGLAQADAAMRNVQQQLNTPGVALTMVLNDALLWQQGYGYADKATKKAVSPADTIFRIGSISKVFSVLWMYKARDDGVLHPDDEVVKHVPQFGYKNPFLSQGKRGVTFQQLASHMAGLPRSTPCSACNKISASEMWARVRNLTLIHPPGARPLYSNCGFNVLGNALAHVYKTDFPTWMVENIMKPIGMTSSGVNITQAPASRLATPYWADGSVCAPSSCLTDAGWADPSGALYSTSGDLGKLLKMLLAQGPQGDSQLLDGTTIRESFAPRYIGTDREGGFATPWELNYFDDYLLRTKQGDVNGYSSEIIMVPELTFGIVVLANTEFHAASYAQAVAAIMIPILDTVFRVLESMPQVPENYKEYIGEYTIANTTLITITGGEIRGQRYLSFYSPSLEVNAILKEVSTDHYQLLPAFHNQESCMNVEFASFFEYVDFVRSSSTKAITGLRIPGLVYELAWTGPRAK